MISEEEGKKQLEFLKLTTDFKAGKRCFPACGFCRYYGKNVRKKDYDTVEITFYCKLTGDGKGQFDSCNKFEKPASSLGEKDRIKNDYLQKYIQPLEYKGIISRVLESPSDCIWLLMTEMIGGRQIRVHIDMQPDIHWIALYVVYTEPTKLKDRIGPSYGAISYYEFCNYGQFLEERIVKAFEELKDLCKENKL